MTEPRAVDAMQATHRERIYKNLRAAIATVRRSCDDAERRLEGKRRDADAITDAMHALVWGQANAFSSIQSAMSALADLNEIAAMDAASGTAHERTPP